MKGMKGNFYIIGVGPGDPELMTLKAVRLLQDCPVWFAPKAHQDGESTALSIVEGVVDRGQKEILEHEFPMKKIRMGEKPDPEVEKAWHTAAHEILQRINSGKDVVFPTLGDPSIYSTGFYVYHTLLGIVPDLQVKIIAGVSSIGSAAAAGLRPLCLGDDRLAVIPATFKNDKLREILADFDTIVLMKVHRVLGRIVPLLEELGLLDQAVLVERCSHTDEKIIRDLRTTLANKPHYFSTIIIRKYS